MHANNDWAAVVRRQSDKFRHARGERNYVDALVAARRVIEACRHLVDGRRALQRGWESDQTIVHYLAIAETMARQYDELVREQKDIVATLPRAPIAAPRPTRHEKEWNSIHQQLEEVSSLMTAVSDAVDVASPAIEALNASVEDGEADSRRAEAAIRHYHDRHVTVAGSRRSVVGVWLCCDGGSLSGMRVVVGSVVAMLVVFVGMHS